MSALLLCMVTVSLLGGFVVGAAPAGACTCDPSPDIRQMAATAGAAFIGEPVRINQTFRTPFGEAELWDFAVERVYRGLAAPVIAVGGAADGDSCHVELGDYGRIGIVAQWRSGHLSVGQCGIFDADVMQQALGSGAAPVAQAELATVEGGDGTAAPEPAAVERRGATPRFMVMAFAAGVAAMGYLVSRRQRRRRERTPRE